MDIRLVLRERPSPTPVRLDSIVPGELCILDGCEYIRTSRCTPVVILCVSARAGCTNWINRNVMVVPMQGHFQEE